MEKSINTLLIKKCHVLIQFITIRYSRPCFKPTVAGSRGIQIEKAGFRVKPGMTTTYHGH
jgi:hypothetical protein